MEKWGRPGQAGDDNMAYVHCMRNTKGYRHTLKIFHTYWVYQNDWSGFEVDNIHKYGEQNYKC